LPFYRARPGNHLFESIPQLIRYGRYDSTWYNSAKDPQGNLLLAACSPWPSSTRITTRNPRAWAAKHLGRRVQPHGHHGRPGLFLFVVERGVSFHLNSPLLSSLTPYQFVSTYISLLTPLPALDLPCNPAQNINASFPSTASSTPSLTPPPHSPIAFLPATTGIHGSADTLIPLSDSPALKSALEKARYRGTDC